MILKTKVLPIEYDEKTKNKAIRLKKFLEKNPDFFKTFLEGDKISYVDEEASIFLTDKVSILDYITKLHPADVLSFLEDDLFPSEMERLNLLHIILNKKLDGLYSFDPEDVISAELGLVYAYFFDSKDYEELKKFLTTEDYDVDKIYASMYEKYRFPFLNLILDKNLSNIRNFFYSEGELSNLLGQMSKTTLYELTTITPPKETEEITLPFTKEDSINLVRSFLETIEPSHTWTKIFDECLKEDKLISDSYDERIKEYIDKDRDTWQCVYGDNDWYIYTPWNNTIEDAIDLVHEFIHYFASIHAKEESTYSSLKEFPSLFFEQVFCHYLLEHGYPKDEIDKYNKNRLYYVYENGESLSDIISYLNSRIEGEVITEEEEIALEQNNWTDTLSPSELKRRVLKRVDDFIVESIETPTLLLSLYPYIEGKYYADIMFERYKSDKSILPSMIYVTNNLKNQSTDEILNYLNLSPPTKEEVLQKVYKKKS